MNSMRWIKPICYLVIFFEQYFLNQKDQNRGILFSLNLGWDLLSVLPKGELGNLDDQLIEKIL